MAPFGIKSILAILSILFLLLPTYIFLFLSSNVDEGQLHLHLCILTIAIFNIAILFGWHAFGISGGLVASALAIIIGGWLVLRIGHHYGCIASLLSFFMSNLLGYAGCRIKDSLVSLSSLKLEKLDERINVLANIIREKKKNINSLDEKLNRYAVLKEAAESFSTTLSLDDVNKLIIDKTSKAVGKPARILLFLIDAEKQELVLTASSNNSTVKTKKGDICDQWVLRHRKSLIVEEITRDFRFPADDTERVKKTFKSLIAVPLLSEHKALGILRMDSLNESAYTQDDLRLLDMVSDLAAVAIQNALLYSKTQELAIRDGLTGLIVRRHFLQRFHEELHRATRSKGKLSIILLDIDLFKSFNDRYGHTAGDLVLKHISQTILSMAKDVDILSRYGGEEIVLLSIGSGRADAVNLAETIRRKIENEPFILRRENIGLTVSIGLSNYPDDAITVEELIRIADERLYKAKVKGRNRVCSS